MAVVTWGIQVVRSQKFFLLVGFPYKAKDNLYIGGHIDPVIPFPK